MPVSFSNIHIISFVSSHTFWYDKISFPFLIGNNGKGRNIWKIINTGTIQPVYLIITRILVLIDSFSGFHKLFTKILSISRCIEVNRQIQGKIRTDKSLKKSNFIFWMFIHLHKFLINICIRKLRSLTILIGISNPSLSIFVSYHSQSKIAIAL